MKHLWTHANLSRNYFRESLNIIERSKHFVKYNGYFCDPCLGKVYRTTTAFKCESFTSSGTLNLQKLEFIGQCTLLLKIYSFCTPSLHFLLMPIHCVLTYMIYVTTRCSCISNIHVDLATRHTRALCLLIWFYLVSRLFATHQKFCASSFSGNKLHPEKLGDYPS